MKIYYVYTLTNRRKTVLYVGMRNNLERRAGEHGDKYGSVFTKKYNVDQLVYIEEFHSPAEAIAREKQLKKFSRMKKEKLVSDNNPEWDSLTGY